MSMNDASLFHTLEPCEDSLIEEAIQIITHPTESIGQKLNNLLNQLDQTYPEVGPTMLVYLAGRGGLDAEMIERFNQDVAMSREEIGRLPGFEMNVVEYICAYLRPRSEAPEGGERILSLLEHLHTRFAHSMGDVYEFFDNAHGIRLLGFLTKEEVEKLENYIEDGGWIADQEEPFHDGVAFMMRHLLNHVRSARRNQTGLWLRGHP